MQVHYINIEYIFQKIYELMLAGDGRGLLYMLLRALDSFLDWITPLAFIVSVLCIAGTIYCSIRMGQLHHQFLEVIGEGHHGHGGHGHGHAVAHGEAEGHGNGQTHAVDHDPHHEGHSINPKWEKVLEHINSEDEGNWRLAILEADIMLDEMMEAQGYRQDTLGDKLKAVEPSDFTTVQLAWEAHLVRNQIAHEGSNFVLTHREAKRVIGLFEKVFKEFHYI